MVPVWVASPQEAHLTVAVLATICTGKEQTLQGIVPSARGCVVEHLGHFASVALRCVLSMMPQLQGTHCCPYLVSKRY